MTLEIAVDFLTGDYLDEDCRCEVWPNRGLDEQCGQPAVARVRSYCDCGRKAIIMICGECLDLLRSGEIMCRNCPRVIVNWTET